MIHVGAGSGYYTAILAELAGPSGRVDAYEIEPVFANRAKRNLADRAQVAVHARSGTLGAFPVADAIYVNAACVRPSEAWLQALAPGGRLLFPLQKQGTLGGMLLVRRPRLASSAWPAQIITRSIFVGCVGLQDEEAATRLAESYAEGATWQSVRSLRFDAVDQRSCWLAGRGWWLSRSPDVSQDGR